MAENLEAQEEVVSALWDFARAQDTRLRETRCTTPGKEVSVNLKAVREAMDRIMAAFGFTVASVD